MRWSFTIFFLTAFTFSLDAQIIARKYATIPARKKAVIPNKINFNGQWRGSFDQTDNSISALLGGLPTTSYVLELEVQDNQISGYSYTYFSDGSKRYYTICRVIGTIDRKANSIIVTEVERTRYNTPPTIRNCFQIHRLYYEKGDDDKEYLKGDWIPAPNQVCTDVGETVLSRQASSRTPFAVKPPPKKPDVARAHRPATPHKPAPERQHDDNTSPEKPETAPATAQVTRPVPPQTANREGINAEALRKRSETITTPTFPHKGYERRENVVVKSIRIESDVFQVDFYDNGVIDGDSISVFYNDNLILSHKMLTTKPLTLTLSVDKDRRSNIITMYADNLGDIPPNTAVMIVRDGKKRHEVRMESDLKKSSSVEFIHDSQ